MPRLADQEEFERRVGALRSRLGLPENFEFKHVRTHISPRLREGFLREALELDFRFAVSTIDKRDRYWARALRREILWACVTDLAAMLRLVYLEAEVDARSPARELVIVDNNDDRDFLALVKQQFRVMESSKKPGQSLLGKVKFEDSAKLAMLQLADMICGVVGTMREGAESNFYDMIRDRDVSR
jgi:hypothetical protein